MFTGIVEAQGRVAAIAKVEGDVRLSIQSDDLPFADFSPGESIAVNGVCLTATKLREDGFDTDMSTETMSVTSLANVAEGSRVNLEPALSLGDRLGGHLVSGHVDCTGTITSIATDARSLRVSIEIPSEYARYVARKGSVCVDGVSLTVNSVSANRFDLNIIPHTAETTIIGSYSEGTIVNVEVDLLARYLERLLTNDADGISLEYLKAHGYV